MLTPYIWADNKIIFMPKFTLLILALTNLIVLRAQTTLPYNQTFDAATLAETGWTTKVYGAGTESRWELSQSTNAGGDAGEVTHPLQYAGNSKTMLVSPALNTAGVSELKLSFNYYLRSKANSTTAKLIVQSSTDGASWTDEQWIVDAGNQERTSGPYTVNTIIKNNTNSTHTFIAFAIVGSFSAIDNWSIDNVNLTALPTCTAPNNQASGLTFTEITTNSVKANWTRGNGAGVVVVARKRFPVESVPTHSTVYAANTIMGSGENIGDESFVVYRGTGSSVTVTNLNQYSDYSFALYEYTSEGCYNTIPLTGKVFTAPPGTKVWKGMSEEWFDGVNWVGGSVPGPTHNVVLPAGCTYYPRLVGTTTVKTLRITEGADLLLDKTPNLTVSDSMIISGNFQMVAGEVTANNVYSYPQALVYIYAGTFTTNGWAGGPTKDYGYGFVHVYGGKLNVTGNMRLAYTSNNTAGLFMSGQGSELNVGGSLNFSSKTQFRTGTINLLGTHGAGPFQFAQQSGGTDHPAAFNVTVNAPSKTYKFNSGVTGILSIYGNLNIIAGTVNLTEGTTSTSLDLSGNIAIGANGVLNCGNANAGITTKGNWDNYSPATFIHNNNSVIFNGKSHKISGSTTFYGLKINPTDASVVTFASGSANKVTVIGPLTLSTIVMGKLALRSDVPGTQWEIDPQGTRTISNVDVRDSKNVNATAINATSATSINTGNNTNWTFGTTASTYISKTVISGFGSVVANTFSIEATFDVSAANLTSNLTINAPTDFQISKTSGSGFTNTLTYTPVTGGVPYQTVYVRMNPSAAVAISGNISIATTGVTTKTIAVSGTGTAAVPIIILNPTTVSNNFGVVPVYSNSSEYSYTVYGSNLTADLTVTVTGEFEISKTSGSDYAKSLTFTQSGGNASGTVYCRYTPKGYYSSGVITHTSTGATNKTVSVSGNGSYQGTLTVSKTSVTNFGDIVVGESSAVDSFTIQGSDLYNYIILRASDGFKLSSSKNSSFRNTWTLYTVSGSLTETKVYVRFDPTVRGAKQGLIEISSSNSMYRYVALSGTGTCSATPKLTASTTSLNFPNTVLNSYSEVIPMVLGGCSLTDKVNLTASSGFEISVYPDKGFTNAVNFMPVSGNVNDTTIFVRTKPVNPNYYSGELAIKSSGAEDKIISLGGTGFYIGPPMLFVNSAAIPTFETTDVNGFSMVQSYMLGGDCLEGDVTITAPEGFLISFSDEPLSGFGSTLLIANSGTITETPVYIVFNPKVKKTYNAFITMSSTGASDKLVNVSGVCAHTVVTLSANTIEKFENVPVNTASAAKPFTISGTEVTSDVVITASENFEVSTTNGSGFSTALTLKPSAGTLNNTTVYVRFKPSEINEYTGEVTITYGGKYETILLTGEGIAGSTSAETIKTKEAFIYPNPADRLFYIRHEMFEGELTVGIYDLEGRSLISHHLEQNEVSPIDIASLPAGVYVVKITNNQTVYINKLFKILQN